MARVLPLDSRSLREKVSIRNLETIIEVLADSGRTHKDADTLTEIVRQRLAARVIPTSPRCSR